MHRKKWHLRVILGLLIGIAMAFVAPSLVHAQGPITNDPLDGTDPVKLNIPKAEGTVLGLRSQASVAGNMGNVGFTHEIRMPQWRAITPQLELVYDSLNGNSVLGQGFDLNIPAISRSPQSGTPTVDTPLMGLGSRELQMVAPNLYRNEVDETYELYEIKGQSIWVKDGKGNLLIFGLTEESREESEAYTYKWHISRITDPFGHSVEYQYEKSGNISFIKQISLIDRSGERYYSIEFEYVDRPDPWISYRNGLEQTMMRRLTSIQIDYVGMGQSERIYRMELTYYETDDTYRRSRLRELVEYGATDNDVYPTIKFEYTDPSHHFGSDEPRLALERIDIREINEFPQPNFSANNFTLTDFNADGLVDILARDLGAGAPGRWRAWFNQGSLDFAPKEIELFSQPILNGFGSTLALADVDGDRRLDLVDGESGRFVVRYSDLNNKVPGMWDTRFEELDDLRNATSGGNWVDLNADSKAEYVKGNAVFWNKSEEGSSSFQREPLWTAMQPIAGDFADVNGDTLPDLIRIDVDEFWSMIRASINQGDGTFGEEVQINISPKPAGIRDLAFNDLNRDGYSDLVILSANELIVYIFKPENLASSTRIGSFDGAMIFNRTSEGQLSAINKLYLTDINGNGSVDLVFPISFSLYYHDFYSDSTTVPTNGLLASVHYSTGHEKRFEYQPITSYYDPNDFVRRVPYIQFVGNVHEEIDLTPTQDRIQDVSRTRYVKADFSWPYYDASRNVFLGFAQTERIDYLDVELTQALRTVTDYYTDEFETALRGKVRTIRQFSLDGMPLKVERWNWRLRRPASPDLTIVSPIMSTKSITDYGEDGTSVTRISGFHYEFDQQLIPTRVAEVHYIAGRVYRTIETEYQSISTESWITQGIESIRLLDARNETAISRRYEYLPGTKLLSAAFRQRDELESRYRTYIYNENGDICKVVDAEGSYSLLEYHTQANHLVYKEHLLTSSGDLGQFARDCAIDVDGNYLTRHFFYDYGFGIPIVIFDYNHSSDDPVLYEFSYDGLGRLISFQKPMDETPSISFKYDLGDESKYSRITATTKGIAFPTVQYLDSQMRPVGLVTPGDNGYVLNDLTIRDMTGNSTATGTLIPISTSELSHISSIEQIEPFIDRYVFDPQNRVVSHVKAGGRGTEHTFYSANFQRFTDAEGNLVFDIFDPLGRHCARISSIDDLSEELRMPTPCDSQSIIADIEARSTYLQHNVADSIISTHVPGQNQNTIITTYSFDAFQRVERIESPIVGTIEYRYFEDDQVWKEIRYDSHGAQIGEIVFKYDGLNRETERIVKTTPSTESASVPDVIYRLTYDSSFDNENYAKNQLSEIEIDTVGTIRYSYDKNSNRSGETLITGQGQYQLKYVHDYLDRLVRIEYPSGNAINYSYSDSHGEVTSLSGAYTAGIEYDATLNINRISSQLGANVSIHGYEYDQISQRLTNLNFTWNENTLLSYKYAEYDNNDQLERLSGHDPFHRFISTTFRYNALNELSASSRFLMPLNGRIVQQNNTYDFDPGGNVIQNGQQSLEYSDNAIKITDSGGDTRYLLDNAGRLVSRNEREIFRWSADDTLSSYENGAEQLVHYFYLPDGSKLLSRTEELGQTTNEYFLGKHVRVLEDELIFHEYVYIDNRIIAKLSSHDKPQIFVANPVSGTTFLVVDEIGNPVFYQDINPFGAPILLVERPESNVVHRFGSGLFDRDSGLIQLRSRYYDPSTGRFASPDLAVLKDPDLCLTSPIDCNLYSYARNNPIGFNDPNGRFSQDVDFQKTETNVEFDVLGERDNFDSQGNRDVQKSTDLIRASIESKVANVTATIYQSKADKVGIGFSATAVAASGSIGSKGITLEGALKGPTISGNANGCVGSLCLELSGELGPQVRGSIELTSERIGYTVGFGFVGYGIGVTGILETGSMLLDAADTALDPIVESINQPISDYINYEMRKVWEALP